MSARRIKLVFELVAPGCLRLVISERAGPILGISEVDPRVDESWGPLQAEFDLVGGDKLVEVEADFPFDPGRARSAKTLIRRAVAAAREAAA